MPAYAPDPRYVFWFALGHFRAGRGFAVVVMTGDTKTGAVRRFEDPSVRSTALVGIPHLDEDGRRLCGDRLLPGRLGPLRLEDAAGRSRRP
jgi:hypothetical protein